MSDYPCMYLSTRKCCCCFNCDPRQVFLILSSTCLLLGLINMCSYPLCPAVIISSLVVAFYYFGSGIYLLYAVTGLHEHLLRVFPWLMVLSYIPIAGYIGCLVYSLECIEKWTMHYSLEEDPTYSKNMYIGILSLYSLFAAVDFLFSTYAMMLSMGQVEIKSVVPAANPYEGSFPKGPTPLAYPAIVETNAPTTDETVSLDDSDTREETPEDTPEDATEDATEDSPVKLVPTTSIPPCEDGTEEV